MSQSGRGGDAERDPDDHDRADRDLADRHPADRHPDEWVGWDDPSDPDGNDPDPSDPDGSDPDSVERAARRAAEHRRTKRGALIGLGIVTVIVAVTIVLVRLVDTGTGLPDNPTEAAREWGVALVHGDKARRHQLECPSGTDTSVFVRPFTHGDGDVRADPAIRVRPGVWHVRLHLPGMTPGGYVVRVVRDRREYDVC